MVTQYLCGPLQGSCVTLICSRGESCILCFEYQLCDGFGALQYKSKADNFTAYALSRCNDQQITCCVWHMSLPGRATAVTKATASVGIWTSTVSAVQIHRPSAAMMSLRHTSDWRGAAGCTSLHTVCGLQATGHVHPLPMQENS